MSRRRRVLIGAGHLAAWIGLAAAVLAQAAGAHPVSGRRFAAVMSAAGADWLDRSERESEEEPDQALDIIGLKKGSVVADIGAGSGYMTIRMARRVGANGIVYANDIQQPMLDLLEQRLKKGKIANVRPILGTLDDPKLPAESIEMALLVDVYHEFSQPQAMLRHLHDALKTGGRLVLLEYRKEDPAIPIRPEHKMSVAEAKLEVEAEGFKLGRVDDSLPRQHVLIFTKR
ncbi:MAG: class I SAM-dependent methyltransferase [Acidobacteriota bacterium]